jgi:hypothetical protein
VESSSQIGRTCTNNSADSSYVTWDSNLIHHCGRLHPGTTPSATEASCTIDSKINCYNHDHGIRSRGPNATIINNIFYENLSGWDIVVDTDGTDNTVVNNTMDSENPGRWGQLLAKSSGMIVENNIFYNDADCGICTYTPSSSEGDIKNNLFYPDIDIRCDVAGTLCQPDGTWTISDNITNSNPFFRDESNDDYHITSQSNAIGEGLSTNAPTLDYDGDIRDTSTPDIGADEYMRRIILVH